MQKLTKERKGEICVELVKLKARQSGISFNDMKRNAGQMASQLKNVSADELMALAFELLPELIGEAFGGKRVSITISD